MTYYAQINSLEELVNVDFSKIRIDEYNSTNVNNYEVAEEEFLKYKAAPYKYNGVEEREIEEEIEVIDYDEEGNPIGSHIETITRTIYVLTLNPNWEEEQLAKAKQEKYNEANVKARAFLESGDALYEFEEGKHIEATEGNIGKFTGFAVGYITGRLQPEDTVDWNTKEDENIELNQEQVGDILNGLGRVQAYVWTVQFPAYVQAINDAQTAAEVNEITIEYYSELPTGENE